MTYIRGVGWVALDRVLMLEEVPVQEPETPPYLPPKKYLLVMAGAPDGIHLGWGPARLLTLALDDEERERDG